MLSRSARKFDFARCCVASPLGASPPPVSAPFAPSQPFAPCSATSISANPLKHFGGAAVEQRFSRQPLQLSYGTVAAQLFRQPPASATKLAAGVAVRDAVGGEGGDV